MPKNDFWDILVKTQQNQKKFYAMAPSGSHRIGPSGQKNKIRTDLEREHYYLKKCLKKRYELSDEGFSLLEVLKLPTFYIIIATFAFTLPVANFIDAYYKVYKFNAKFI